MTLAFANYARLTEKVKCQTLHAYGVTELHSYLIKEGWKANSYYLFIARIARLLQGIGTLEKIDIHVAQTLIGNISYSLVDVRLFFFSSHRFLQAALAMVEEKIETFFSLVNLHQDKDYF